MISRRLIRIKVLQVFYAYVQKPGRNLEEAVSELKTSLKRTLYLYYSILRLLLDLFDYAQRQIDMAKAKKMPSNEDLHPSLRFVSNSIIGELRSRDKLMKALEASQVSWAEHGSLVRKLYRTLVESEIYIAFMSRETIDTEDEVEILHYILTDLFANSQDLELILEEISIYWNDELEFVLSTFDRLVEVLGKNPEMKIGAPNLFKNRLDEKFSEKLLQASILHREEYLELIEKFTENWDIERIALMDILLLTQSISEVINFEDIPIRVTINEYIEIAKYYSTPRSSVFINGVLDKIVHHLKEKKMIQKSGRGLIGDETMPAG